MGGYKIGQRKNDGPRQDGNPMRSALFFSSVVVHYRSFAQPTWNLPPASWPTKHPRLELHSRLQVGNWN